MLLMSNDNGDLFDKEFDKGALRAANEVNSFDNNAFSDILAGSGQHGNGISANFNSANIHRGGAQPRQQTSDPYHSPASSSQPHNNTDNLFSNSGGMGGGGTGGYDNMITVMLADSKFFKIADGTFEFNDQDPIFALEKPTLKKEYMVEKGVCTSCQSTFKSVKAVSYCDFCGCPVCKTCLVKQRPLPGSSSSADHQQPEKTKTSSFSLDNSSHNSGASLTQAAAHSQYSTTQDSSLNVSGG
jgi:hypothetical protein